MKKENIKENEEKQEKVYTLDDQKNTFYRYYLWFTCKNCNMLKK